MPYPKSVTTGIPTTDEQLALVADLERETRLIQALGSPMMQNAVGDMDSRRVRKVAARQYDAACVRYAALASRLEYLCPPPADAG